MLLVKCDRFEHIEENNRPVAVLCAKVVSEITDEEGNTEFQEVIWNNPSTDSIKDCPPPNHKVRLEPYQGRLGSVLIMNECRAYNIWGGPILFLFYTDDLQMNGSACLGKIYAVTVL